MGAPGLVLAGMSILTPFMVSRLLIVWRSIILDTPRDKVHAAECRSPAGAVPLDRVGDLFELPFPHMGAAVHVQHLPGYLTGLGQIEYGVNDILDVRDTSQR